MSEWISWDGGSCPVNGGVDVDVLLRDGYHNAGRADSFSWKASGANHDIVRYRVSDIYHTRTTPTPSQTTTDHDPVNKPSHYMLFPEQGVEFIDVRDVLIERLTGFSPRQIDYWSRAFEYLARAGGKNGVEDIKKAKWYLDRLVKTLEEKE